jgi:hypothetical protein
MAIYVSAIVAMCTLVVLWAIKLDPDVDAIIALAILGVGVAIHMFSPSEEEAN